MKHGGNAPNESLWKTPAYSNGPDIAVGTDDCAVREIDKGGSMTLASGKSNTFCVNIAVNKDRTTKQADVAIVRLKADFEKARADASKLGKEIAAHDEDISGRKGDVKVATKVWNIDKTITRLRTNTFLNRWAQLRV